MADRAVLYLRLSKEDKDKLNEGDDSASIKNQRLLLMDYALKKDFQVVDVYSDDDESGLYDDRPDFDRMIQDAKLGLFHVIIAKTQSRFSRNMEHIEKYLHHDFPNMGIRFIGVVDGVDTDDEANKKTRQINGLVNEWYCEELSKNVRAAFRAKMRDGQYLAPYCLYGYQKDPENHNHLVIDEYAARVVRRIYKLYLAGYGKQKIGSILTKEGILIPSLYKTEILGQKYHNANIISTTKVWSYQTIHSILNNETYTGKTIQNRANKLSYKDKKKKVIPKDDWIIVDGTHEPIISKEVYEEVQYIQQLKTKSVRGNESNGIFSGLIYCADCKHAMARKYARRGQHRFIGYMCKTYKQQGKNFCESHSIDLDELEEAVLLSVQMEARKILKGKDLDELKDITVHNDKSSLLEEEMKDVQKRMQKIQEFKKKTYNNYMEELITKDDYISYIAGYDSDLEELKEAQKSIEEKQLKQNDLDQQYDEWVEAFKDYINIKTLTREVVLELINKIEVNNDGSINIYYKFSNPYME